MSAVEPIAAPVSVVAGGVVVVRVTDVEEVVMVGVVPVVVVTGGVVVVTVSVGVLGGVLVVGSPLPGSDGPPPDSAPPAEPIAFERADPAWPLPDPQLAAARPTRGQGNGQERPQEAQAGAYLVPTASCHRTMRA